VQKHVRVIFIKNLYHQYFLKMGKQKSKKEEQKNLEKKSNWVWLVLGPQS